MKKPCIKPVEEKVEQVPTEEPKVVPVGKSKLEEWFERAPIAATGVPTLRWYGEEFLPQYKAWLEEGAKLVK